MVDEFQRVSRMSLWKEASPEETDRIIEKVAREVIEREMDLPATLLIGTLRPVSYIGGQLGRVFLAPFTPLFENLPYEYISVFEKNENLVRLINRISELGEEKETEKKNKKEELKGKKRRDVFGWIRGLVQGNREGSTSSSESIG